MSSGGAQSNHRDRSVRAGEGHVMMQVKLGLMTFFLLHCDLQSLSSPMRD